MQGGLNMGGYGGPNLLLQQHQQQQQQQQQRQQQQQHMTSPHMQPMSRVQQPGLGGLDPNQQQFFNLQRSAGGNQYNNQGMGGNILGGGGISGAGGLNIGGIQGIGNIGGMGNVGGMGGFSGVNRGFGGSEIPTGGGGSGQPVGSIGAKMGMLPPGGGFGRGGSTSEDFAIEKEDFPALPGSSSKSNADHPPLSEVSKESMTVSSQAMNQGLKVNSEDILGGVVDSDGSLQQQQQPQQQQQLQQHGRTAEDAKYGLPGLIDVLRHTDKNHNWLAVGIDLTKFGLNLNSENSLYSTFCSPFTNQTLSPDPQFRTPPCYMMHPPSLKSEHLSKFQLETLFYMFFSMPKDILQACAAQELYKREWRYHGELKVWLKARAPQELMQSHPSVQYVYFDCQAWEARLFTTSKGNIAAGLLGEEEVRVRAPQPATAAS